MVMAIELILSILLVLACFETPFDLKCMAALNQSQSENQNDSQSPPSPPPPSSSKLTLNLRPMDLSSVVVNNEKIADDSAIDEDKTRKILVRKRRAKQLYKNYKASFYLNPGWYRDVLPPTRRPLPMETAENPYPPPIDDPFPDSPPSPPPLPEHNYYGVVLRQNFPPPLPPPISKSVSTWVSNFAGYVGPVYFDEEDKKQKKKEKGKTKKIYDEKLNVEDISSSLFSYFTSLLFGHENTSDDEQQQQQQLQQIAPS